MMRLLLDTHVLLWWLVADRRLSARARSALEEGRHVVYVSAASAWEIAIKTARGKLALPPGGEVRIRETAAAYGFTELPITFDHALGVRGLPRHHGDPFDRLLVAQCRHESLALVTNDAGIRRYDVAWIW